MLYKRCLEALLLSKGKNKKKIMHKHKEETKMDFNVNFILGCSAIGAGLAVLPVSDLV